MISYSNLIVCGPVDRSYHDGEHYNSVRLKNDDGSGPAKPIVIEEDDSVKEKYKSSSTSGKRVYDQESVKLVLSGTGCADITRVHDVLQQVHGDTDAAIEFLIAEQTSTVEDEVKSCAEIDANGGDEDLLIGSPPNINNASERNSINIQSSLSEAEKDKHEGAKETCRYQKTSRNNPCSCGSKKKHKACCKVERHKFDAKSTSQEALTNKVRKMKLRGSKSEIQSSQSCATAAMGPPDLGALYI
ncbi:OVARIAN TUMOR DOMAIN-containing deubiquitinating enzyme 7 isoform X1 [Cryptomeria japonica]|uniref:OVARIAN TUMOR DOMAIN-containing deubiquitinating enzyme 7 isoform X1 n=1 Tax=Cryptomeria japonica TaxID=3369 RepID=UPI0027DA592F|nr:OVARIAN TUMOR DOMAIN-containing deubiquitinating enzyme 7 isoform X1 [Cryptomeria japonica]